MSDKVVYQNEWWELHKELSSFSEDVVKVESFMITHVLTKWGV